MSKLVSLIVLGLFAGLALARAAENNLRWQTADGFRFAKLPVPGQGKAGFSRLMPLETGLAFTNQLSNATVSTNRLLEIGSGVALGDVDGDGWVDVYFSRLEGSNALYRNLGGWKFEDITARAGVACSGQFSTGCALADLDGDGDLDLLVNSLGGGTRAFLNDGQAGFTPMTDNGLVRRFGATSLALADVDGDGDLDLYVTNYRTDLLHDHPPGLRTEVRQLADGTRVIEPQERFVTLPTPQGALEVVERGEADFLYLNRGGGRFNPAPWNVGVFLDEDGRALPGPATDWGLAVMFRDMNGDGLPDLYICNDFIYWPDRLWLNVNGRRFQAAPRQALRHVSLSSMAVDAADINRDGHDDLFIVEMLNPRREARAWQQPDKLRGTVTWPVDDPDFRPEAPHNTLQLARGDGTFAEIARLAGVTASDWSWSASFLDVDLDGWEDLLITTGSNHDVQDLDALEELSRAHGWKTPASRLKIWEKMPRRAAPGVAFRNRRDLTFENASTAWGFDAVGVAHGMAMGDLDNDGDLDVVLNCLHEPARVYRNDSSVARVAVRLRGAGANTRGVGAKIKVRGGPVAQSQEMIAAGRYLSSDDFMRTFAAGEAKELEIEVTWRSGRRSLIRSAKPDFIYEIAEDSAATAPVTAEPLPQPLFEDVSDRVRHVHKDEPFNDFARQPLLPRKLSTPGPGVSWADVDGDGQDDLLVGGGKTGRLAVFRNDGLGSFTEWTNAPIPKFTPRDQTSLLVRKEASGAQIIVGESSWEEETNTPPVRIFALRGPPPALPKIDQPFSTGPLALADIDGDGDLDLFVGGRAIAGRYPEPAASLVLRAEGGSFQLHKNFPALGLVNGAVFTDVDGDGDPDLALACEWDSIRLFRNEEGKFTEATDALGLRKFRGWWNGIAAGDFDGDGRLDLIVSNWGRNWRIDLPPGASTNPPVQLVWGDFAGNGVVQTLLASHDPFLNAVTPWRERKAVMAAIPAVAARLPTFHDYGRASLREVLGDSPDRGRQLEADVFDSMVFLNRGDHFEARALPVEAQFAPAFGVCVADFDGDGNEDIFLAQNFFGVDEETTRHDAGTGLILPGDGRGSFRALGPRAAGFSIYGEQRGCAVADFDRDGRTDLAVGQQRGPLRLLRNVHGRPGVRLVLRGPPENPDAIGSVVRLHFGTRAGPAREIHGGSGFLSQDSPTILLAAPMVPTEVEVRWPGGKTQRWPWPRDAQAAEISAAGLSRQR